MQLLHAILIHFECECCWMDAVLVLTPQRPHGTLLRGLCLVLWAAPWELKVAQSSRKSMMQKFVQVPNGSIELRFPLGSGSSSFKEVKNCKGSSSEYKKGSEWTFRLVVQEVRVPNVSSECSTHVLKLRRFLGLSNWNQLLQFCSIIFPSELQKVGTVRCAHAIEVSHGCWKTMLWWKVLTLFIFVSCSL